MKEEIDIEENHLVIYKDMDGKFHHFEWIPIEKKSLEDVTAKIIEYNEKTAEQKEGH